MCICSCPQVLLVLVTVVRQITYTPDWCDMDRTCMFHCARQGIAVCVMPGYVFAAKLWSCAYIGSMCLSCHVIHKWKTSSSIVTSYTYKCQMVFTATSTSSLPLWSSDQGASCPVLDTYAYAPCVRIFIAQLSTQQLYSSGAVMTFICYCVTPVLGQWQRCI